MRWRCASTLAVVAAVLLVQPAPAQPPAVTEVTPPPPAKWAEVKADVGQLVRLTVGDRPAKWLLIDHDQNADLHPCGDGKLAVFAAKTPGRYRVITLIGDEVARVVVVVGGVPPPNPPNPNPNPPQPVPPADPLRAKFRLAYDADGGAAAVKEAARKDLAELYRQAAQLAADPTVLTTGELVDRIRRAGQLLAGDVLPGLRKTIGGELSSVFPADIPLDSESRVKAAALFTTISNALNW